MYLKKSCSHINRFRIHCSNLLTSVVQKHDIISSTYYNRISIINRQRHRLGTTPEGYATSTKQTHWSPPDACGGHLALAPSCLAFQLVIQIVITYVCFQKRLHFSIVIIIFKVQFYLDIHTCDRIGVCYKLRFE